MNTDYIPNYIGTVSISEYDKVRNLITPILKKFCVGLKGRGRGSRLNGKRGFFGRYNPWNQSIPLPHSSLVGLYIRVEPTKKFLGKYKPYYSQTDMSVVWNFENMVCPIIRDEIREVLKQNGIKVIRT